MTKRKTFRLGKSVESRRIFQIPEEVLVETIAILGRRGSGKTNTGVRLVEQALDQKHQAIILDPLDVWWGLKARQNGKPSGLAVLLLGDPRKPHTDLPLTEGDGKALANLLVDETLSAVLSMRHLSKSAMKRFTADFLETLYLRKGDPDKATACLVVSDEASLTCPQKMPAGDPTSARCVGAMESIVRQGRASGLGAMLIDQRPASVNKDVLTQVELMIIHQLTAPHDRKAVKEWIDTNAAIDDDQVKHFMASLSSLTIPRSKPPASVAWVWSPAWLGVFEQVSIDFRDTFDSSKTPKPGDAAVKAAKVTKFDLDDIRGRWSDVIEKVERADPKKLEKQLAAAQREAKTLRDKVDQLESRPAIDEAEAQLLADAAAADRDGWWREQLDTLPTAGQVREACDGAAAKLIEVAYTLGAAIDEVRGFKTPKLNGAARPSRSAALSARPRQRDKPAARPQPTAPRGEPHPDINKPKQAILDALAWFESVGQESTQRSHVASIAGVSPRSSGFEKNISTLRTAGLISYPSGGEVALTVEGRDAANPPSSPATLAALHQAWLDSPAISRPQAAILKHLINNHPSPRTRELLADAVGVSAKSSGFEKNVSRLSSLGLIVYPAPGQVVASAAMFPDGLY